jgi:hypothetical protein
LYGGIIIIIMIASKNSGMGGQEEMSEAVEQ